VSAQKYKLVKVNLSNNMSSEVGVKAWRELMGGMESLSTTELNLLALIIDIMRVMKSQQRGLDLITEYEPMLKAELERREENPLSK